MFSLFESLLELAIFVSSIFLIVAGSSSKEKYLSAIYIRKRILIIGIVLLVLAVLAGMPDMYHGFIGGWKAARSVH